MQRLCSRRSARPDACRSSGTGPAGGTRDDTGLSASARRSSVSSASCTPRCCGRWTSRGRRWPSSSGPTKCPNRAPRGRAALALSDLQAVERDFAFVVGSEVEALSVVNAAQGADKGLIESVTVFDEFVGGALGEGRKSLAISVRLQPTDRTLTEDEIEAVAAKIVEKVGKATGGVLRG